MTDRIYAPWTEQQIAALNAFQRAGAMHPFTCGGSHEMHQTLIAEADGWHCPDEQCDYRQNWAHAFMADPTMPGRLAADLPLAARPPENPALAELARVRRELRATQDQLAAERNKTAALTDRLAMVGARIEALQVHEAIVRIPAPAAPPCGEILHGQTIADAGSIDTWQEQP